MQTREEKLAKRNVYARMYRKAHREKIRARSKVYYAAHKEYFKTKKKAWGEANKGKRVAYDKAYYKANQKEKITHSRAYREANKEKINANRRACTIERRIEMVLAYGGKCRGCGIDDPIILDIDHINNNGRCDRRNGFRGYRLYNKLRKEGWPKENHQLLCKNCNYRKEMERLAAKYLEKGGM